MHSGYYLLLITYYLLPITYYLLPITYYLLLIFLRHPWLARLFVEHHDIIDVANGVNLYIARGDRPIVLVVRVFCIIAKLPQHACYRTYIVCTIGNSRGISSREIEIGKLAIL